jgi:hypothetical protein
MLPDAKDIPRRTKPSIYTKERTARILTDIAGGNSMISACVRNGISHCTFYDWSKHPAIGAALAQAREWAIEARLDRAEQVLEEVIGCEEGSGPAVSAANNLAHYHKWVAAAHHAALYGPKSSVKQEVSGSLSITISKDDDAL